MNVFTRLYVLAWMPTLKKRLAKRQQSGERTAEEVRKELGNMKFIIICTLLVRCGKIYSHFLVDMLTLWPTNPLSHRPLMLEVTLRGPFRDSALAQVPV